MAPTTLVDLYRAFDQLFNTGDYVEGEQRFSQWYHQANTLEIRLLSGIFQARFHLIRGDHENTKAVLASLEWHLTDAADLLTVRAELFHTWGEYYYYTDNPKAAKKYIEVAIGAKRQLLHRDQDDLFLVSLGQSLVVLGKVEWKQANHGDVLLHYYEALSCYQQANGHHHRHLIGRLYCLIGQVHYSNGESERARMFLECSLQELRLSTTNPDHLYLSATYLELARATLMRDEIFDFEEIQQYIIQGNAILDRNLLTHPHRYYASLADTWSLYYTRRAKLGAAPEQRGELYEKALTYLERSYQLRRKIFAAHHSSLALVSCYRARIYLKLNDTDRAWAAAERALQHLLNQEQFSALHHPLPPFDPPRVASPRVYVFALGLLAAAYAGQLGLHGIGAAPSLAQIRRALSWLEEAQKAIDYWRKAVRFEISLALAVPQIRRVQELHFQWLFELSRHQLTPGQEKERDDKIFTWIQQRKVDWLQELIETKGSKARKINLSSSLADFQALESKLFSRKSGSAALSSNDLIEKLREHISNYRMLSLTSMEHGQRKREQVLGISLAECWQMLGQSQDRILASYFSTRNKLYVIVFQTLGQQQRVLVRELLATRAEVAQVHKAAQDCDQILAQQFDKHPARLAHSAQLTERDYLLFLLHKLHQKLIQPLALPPGVSLCLVPDDWLYQVPFDALITELPAQELSNGSWRFPPDPSIFRKLNYLFLRNPITYHYSAAALCRYHLRRRGKDKSVPVKFHFSSVGTMSDQGTKDYHEVLLNIVESLRPFSRMIEILTDENLDEDDLHIALYEADIIHILAHNEWTSNDRKDLRITLRNYRGQKQQLTREQIRKIPLQAELVILNVCRGNHGPDPFGEGPDGYARAFLEAGAANVITALFRTTVNATEALTLAVVEHLLLHQMTYEKAVQAAKRALLTRFPHCEHPAYWAGFTLMGNGRDRLSLPR